MSDVFVQVRQTGDCYRATSTDPRLRGLEWRWWGGEYVEVGLTPRVSDDWRALVALGVWDHEANCATVERTWDAFGRWVRDRYADDDEVEALVAEVAGAW